MSNCYGSIPPANFSNTSSAGSAGNGESNSNCKLYIALGAILVGLGVFLRGKSGDATTPAPAVAVPVVQEPPEEAKHWPETLVKMDAAFGKFPNFMFTNSAVAEGQGWVKSMDDPCDPMLGEAWLYQGERALNYSAALYFTPEVGDVPGVLSGIGVDYYGYVEEKLIGKFFGEEKHTSEDGTFRTVSVALRNGAVENLCDTDTPVAPGNPNYVVISPGMANIPIPATENKAELEQGGWNEGSCIPTMGFHYEKFMDGSYELPHKAENMVPVVPMYSSTDGTLNGIFFHSSSTLQFWPEDCPVSIPSPCAEPSLNMWDYSPGLSQRSTGRFYMCSNFCGDCEMEGTTDGIFTTMHWFFKNTFGENCGSDRKTPTCRSGKYPSKD